MSDADNDAGEMTALDLVVSEIATLEAELSEIDEQIESVEELRKNRGAVQKAINDRIKVRNLLSGTKPEPVRAPRGSLDSAIAQCLAKATAPMSVGEVASVVGFARSSVRAALLRGKGTKFNEADDLKWSMAPQRA